jgi:hypothetical protein
MSAVDAVLSFHINAYTCGVAKWSIRLARELGVPFHDLRYLPHYQRPMVSLKLSEVRHMLWPGHGVNVAQPYELFLHDVPDFTNEGDRCWIQLAERIYAANTVIARAVRESMRTDVIEAWCPSTIETPPKRADLTILTFGMAHKLVSPHYRKLKALLDAHGEPYTVLLSTGVHEGSPWDEALEAATASLGAIFGDRLEVLGYLSDAALDREIRRATFCAAFYTPAFRANNTSGWAVVERGTPLITNLDEDSPRVHCYDIDKLTALTLLIGTCWDEHIAPRFGWPILLNSLRAELPCAS